MADKKVTGAAAVRTAVRRNCPRAVVPRVSASAIRPASRSARVRVNCHCMDGFRSFAMGFSFIIAPAKEACKSAAVFNLFAGYL